MTKLTLPLEKKHLGGLEQFGFRWAITQLVYLLQWLPTIRLRDQGVGSGDLTFLKLLSRLIPFF